MYGKGRLALTTLAGLAAGLTVLVALEAAVSAAPAGRNRFSFPGFGTGWALPHRPQATTLQYQLVQTENQRLQLTVANPGKEAVELQFSGPVYDLVLRDSSGAVVWQLHQNGAWMQMVHSLRLAPGEEQVYTLALPDLDPGRYVAEAYLLHAGAARKPVAKAAVVIDKPDPPARPEGTSDLRFDLEAVESAGGARLLLTLRNTGEHPLVFSFRTGQEFDLVVRDPQGDEVWRWSAGRSFAQVLHEWQLEPGETRSFASDLPAGLKLGTYTVEAWFLATGYTPTPVAREQIPLPLGLKQPPARPLPKLPWLRPIPVWPQSGQAR